MAIKSIGVLVELRDKFSQPLKQLTVNADHSISKLSRLSTFASSTVSKLKEVGATAAKISLGGSLSGGAVVASATNVAAKYEDLGAVLEGIEGSSNKAQQSLAWIKKFTKDTPYELQNTSTAFSRLKAYGIDPLSKTKNVYGSLGTLGDAAAGMGKDIMDAVEMIADAVVGENERLKEFGIRGSAIKGTNFIEYSYKDKSGKQQTARANKNDQEQIRATLMAIFDEKFLGAMEKRSKTFNGLVSNLKDTVAGLQGQFMSGGLFDMMKNSLQSRLDWLTKLSESGKVEQWGRNTARAFDLIGDSLGAMTQYLVSSSVAILAFASKWDVLSGKLGLSTERIDQLKQAGTDLKQLWADIWTPADTSLSIDGAGKQESFLERLNAISVKAFDLNIIKNYGTALAFLSTTALPLLLSGYWRVASVSSRLAKTTYHSLIGQLPQLKTTALNVFNTVAQWAMTNGSRIKAALGEAINTELARLGFSLEKLNAMAKDGRLRVWLDNLLAKINPIVTNIAAFAGGIWLAGEAIADFVVWAAEFAGGWENLGKIAVGLFVFTKLGGFIAALASALQVIVSLGSILGVVGGAVAGLSRVLGITALFKALTPIIMAAGRAFLWTSAAFLLSPIGLVLTGIAAAAYLVYRNWERLVKWWNGASLKKQVMPLVTATLDYAKAKWEQLKNWWNHSTLGEKVLGIITAPVQVAWVFIKDFFNWFKTTELGKKTLKIATDTITWAKTKIEQFTQWWNTTTWTEKAVQIGTGLLEWAWNLIKRFVDWWKGTSLGKKSAEIATDSIQWATEKVNNFINWWSGLKLNPLRLEVNTGGLATAAAAVSKAQSAYGAYKAVKLFANTERGQNLFSRLQGLVSNKKVSKSGISRQDLASVLAQRNKPNTQEVQGEIRVRIDAPQGYNTSAKVNKPAGSKVGLSANVGRVSW